MDWWKTYARYLQIQRQADPFFQWVDLSDEMKRAFPASSVDDELLQLIDQAYVSMGEEETQPILSQN